MKDRLDRRQSVFKVLNVPRFTSTTVLRKISVQTSLLLICQANLTLLIGSWCPKNLLGRVCFVSNLILTIYFAAWIKSFWRQPGEQALKKHYLNLCVHHYWFNSLVTCHGWPHFKVAFGRALLDSLYVFHIQCPLFRLVDHMSVCIASIYLYIGEHHRSFVLAS